MFYHWNEDQNEEYELAKQHGYLVGSFFNPEAVKNILGSNQHSSTDEEFDETFEKYVLNSPMISQEEPILHRRKRKINGNRTDQS